MAEDKISKKKLLLHACCAPCSSHCLELLEQEYDITVFFYNPNMSTEEEYIKRWKELERFVAEAPFTKEVNIVCADYNPEEFYEIARGLENVPERGERCYKCYELRMAATAKYASENDYDIFTTTLSISPHKNAKWINEIGERLSAEYNKAYLYSDFKKKNGYLRSIELSKEYSLYRQDFCGCIFSKKKI